MTKTTLLDRPLIQTPVRVVRRTRRAYLGALGVTYDFAAARAQTHRAQITALFGELVDRGESIETDAKALLARAKTEARDTFKIGEATKTASTLVSDVDAKTAPAVAEAPEGVSVDEMSDALQAQIKRVQGYDPMVDPAAVAKIVTHLGIALQSRDGRYVACSDEAERKTVAKSWLAGHLNVAGEPAQLDAKVGAVCEIMKADRMKDRVTFYYLLAKNEGALGQI